MSLPDLCLHCGEVLPDDHRPGIVLDDLCPSCTAALRSDLPETDSDDWEDDDDEGHYDF